MCTILLWISPYSLDIRAGCIIYDDKRYYQTFTVFLSLSFIHIFVPINNAIFINSCPNEIRIEPSDHSSSLTDHKTNDFIFLMKILWKKSFFDQLSKIKVNSERNWKFIYLFDYVPKRKVYCHLQPPLHLNNKVIFQRMDSFCS